jgi:hypothetical protein
VAAAVRDVAAQQYAVAAVRDVAAQRYAVAAVRDVAERRCAVRDVAAQRRAAALAWEGLRDAEQVLRAAAGLVSSVPVKTRLSSARAKQQSEVMRRREP